MATIETPVISVATLLRLVANITGASDRWHVPGGLNKRSEFETALYICKLIDLVWFDTLYPSDLNRKIQISLNPAWSPGAIPTMETDKMAGLNFKTLQDLSERLKKPTWASTGLKISTNIYELEEESARKGSLTQR